MKTSVVSNEYQKLQEEIMKLQEQWKQNLNPDSIDFRLDSEAMKTGVPLVALTNFDVKFPLFVQWVDELKQLLMSQNADLESQLNRVIELIDEETAKVWMEEAFSFNHLYFKKFAEENVLDEWIPPFLAETLFRPYLQLLSEKTQSKISQAVAGCGCPVCGEPVRLGQLEGKGQKILYCPRCHANWPEKKLSCSHCGNEDYEKMKYLTVEGKPTEQIHVCDECKGYTKIIDTRQFITKPSPEMLDLKTIHLDYIAQENGYMVMGEIKK
ncbi:formate dehydrogenase accessory protein FdhE [Pseudoneobacillus rhizosphaerae]|uniref:Protein FdhE n=1 Tax=Pseudoneobacillus rhizosphaerae TaxID=2880968 RepID=A0A9C7G676_9BACI|nr:formate dehydrogenase accessory protein FdhE [Pseudoneobacillus rhizosphaerae]CAG9606741.1 Protein FdhE [Pseudoneobacillus rhizosphaerae]